MLANTIQSIMTHHVMTVPPEATFKEALSMMGQNGISSVVTSVEGKPVGIITERDVLRLFASDADFNKIKVTDIMTSPVKTISQTMDVYDAAIFMNQNHIRRIVVVDKKGLLTGIVTQTDLRNHLSSAYYVRLKNIESIMTTDVITASCDEPLGAAANTMFKHNLGCIVICKDNKPIGIVTERDILHIAANGQDIKLQPVGDLIRKPLVTITAETSVYEANKIMKRNHFRRLVIVDDEGKLSGLLTESDIVKHLELTVLQSLREIIEKDKTWANSLKEGLFESTAGIDGVLTWINPAGAEILGYSSPNKVLGKRIREIFADEAELQKLIDTLQGGKVAQDFCAPITRRSGNQIFVEGTFYYLKDEEGKVMCMEGTLRDVTDRKRIEDKIKQKVDEQTKEIKKKNRELEKLNSRLTGLSMQDGLTGISNYRHFSDVLEDEYKKARRYNRPMSCILLDVDDFKFINDRFGHAAGDLALTKTAELLRRLVRETDIVARYGGDEFAIVLTDTGSAGAINLGNRILAAFRQYELKKGTLPLGKISLSIGVASIPDDNRIECCKGLIEAADKAMYHAKQNGKNNCCTSLDILLS